MSDNTDSDKIEIFLSDDQKIKVVGELLTNNSSRTILQLLFEGELTASEISLKSGISLQLVKYHLNKMQQVGMVKISRIGKNIKAHDMKYYKATKFAIVILPSKVSDRARESKSLIRSFKTIYRFAGVGVAAVAGLFSISYLQEQSRVPPEPERQDEVSKTTPDAIPTEPQVEGKPSEHPGSVGEAGKDTSGEAPAPVPPDGADGSYTDVSPEPRPLDGTTSSPSESPEALPAPVPPDGAGESITEAPVEALPEPRPLDGTTSSLEESLEIHKRRVEDVNFAPDSGVPYMDMGEPFVSVIAIAVVLGGLAAYFFIKARRYSLMRKM